MPTVTVVLEWYCFRFWCLLLLLGLQKLLQMATHTHTDRCMAKSITKYAYEYGKIKYFVTGICCLWAVSKFYKILGNILSPVFLFNVRYVCANVCVCASVRVSTMLVKGEKSICILFSCIFSGSASAAAFVYCKSAKQTKTKHSEQANKLHCKTERERERKSERES